MFVVLTTLSLLVNFNVLLTASVPIVILPAEFPSILTLLTFLNTFEPVTVVTFPPGIVSV